MPALSFWLFKWRMCSETQVQQDPRVGPRGREGDEEIGREGEKKRGRRTKDKGNSPWVLSGREAGLPLTTPPTFLNYHSCLVCCSESSAFVSPFLAGEVVQLHSLWELHFQGRCPSQLQKGWYSRIFIGPTWSSFPCQDLLHLWGQATGSAPWW